MELNLYRIISSSMVLAMLVVSSAHAEEKNADVSAGKPESFLSRMESMVAAGDEAGVRVAIGELAGLPDNDVEKSARLLRLGDLAERKGFSPMARYIYAMIATLKNANAQQRSATVLRSTHSYAEEGCVPPGSNSCDLFGLPRESQQVRYDKAGTDYHTFRIGDAVTINNGKLEVPEIAHHEFLGFVLFEDEKKPEELIALQKHLDTRVERMGAILQAKQARLNLQDKLLYEFSQSPLAKKQVSYMDFTRGRSAE